MARHFVIFLLVCCAACQARTGTDAAAHQLALGAGAFDVNSGQKMTVISVSYEFAKWQDLWDIRPMVLAMGGTGDIYYTGAGGLRTWSISQNWQWGIGAMFGGVYAHSNNDIDLNYDFEFYSRLFVDYNITPNSLLRLEFGHISNGGFGRNSLGSESLILSWVSAL